MTPSAPKDMRGSIRAPTVVPAASMKSRRFICISQSPFLERMFHNAVDTACRFHRSCVDLSHLEANYRSGNYASGNPRRRETATGGTNHSYATDMLRGAVAAIVTQAVAINVTGYSVEIKFRFSSAADISLVRL